MAFWTGSIKDINEGFAANDGSGDSIRAAFFKVDENFQEINSFLGNATVDFLNANVAGTIKVLNANITNISSPNIVGVNSTFTSNVTVGNLNANVGIHNQGVTTLTGNTYAGNVYLTGGLTLTANTKVSAHIIPTANLQADLGSPSFFFRNIYAQGLVQINTVTASSDAGLLTLHANLLPGDNKDVGIFGKFYDAGMGGNAYAYFGFQDTTNNFIYKITATDVTLGNSVVYDGVYGNVQFGSQLLSNTTPATNTSTGALVVAGGVGVAGTIYGNINSTVANVTRMNVSGTVSGNLSVDGYVFSRGSEVITTNSIGLGTPYAGGIITGNTVFVSGTTSTSANTGAVCIPFGGLGVFGNVVAGGFVGTLYGNVLGTTFTTQTLNSVAGVIGNLTVTGTTSTGSLQTTTIGVTNITATGNVNVSTINGLTALAVTGNVTAGGFVGPLFGTVMTAAQPNITSVGTLSNLTVSGTIIGNVSGTLQTAAQPNITSVGTLTSLSVTGNVATGNVSGTKGTFTQVDGTLNTAAQPNVTSVGTLTGLTVSGNTVVNNTVYGRGVFDNSNRVLSTSTGAGNLTISGNAVTMSLIGPGAGTVGSATAIPIITTDAYGRVVATTTAAISTTLNTTGTTGTGSVNLLTQGLTIAGGSGVTTSASGQTVTVTSTDTLATVTGRGSSTTTPVTFNGQVNVGASIIPTANLSYNLGSTTSWFNTFYGVSSQAQYADLAEKYTSDAEYEPGTVVVFGGTHEVTVTSEFADTRVAGAVSTDPAYLMNATADGVAVALRGRIPVKVVGPVQKGDLLVTSTTPGYAQSVGNDRLYSLSVFAKSLVTDLSGGEKTIEAVII